MKVPSRRAWGPLALGGLTALALAGASQVPSLAPRGALGSVEQFFVVLGLALAAGLHRPFAGSGLGLGTLVLPPAFTLLGVLPAALAAGGAVTAIELVHRGLARSNPLLPPERRHPGRTLVAALQTALATLAAGAAWNLAAGETGAANPILFDATAAAAAAYLLVSIGVRFFDHRMHRPGEPAEALSVAAPLGLDLGGFWAGAALATVAAGGGAEQNPSLAFALAAVLALLSLEAFRNGRRVLAAEQRASELEEVSRAGQRVITGSPQLVALADQIRAECAKLLRFRWFQLALESSGVRRSWAAGPDGVLYEGAPNPERTPPARPGFHRRSAWMLLDYPLSAEGRGLATLRLWCDPRAIDASEVALVEALLPQLAASVHRALLEREANLDPLTGVAMRRVLEQKMEVTYRACVEDGASMTILMCDLDHFKRINDTHGHAAGDQALVAVARVLSGRIKQRDLCCRWGGEEFMLLLVDADGATGLVVAERLRKEVEKLAVTADGKRLPLNLSIGVAAFPELYVTSPAELAELADGALYQAKRRGRNLCLLDMGRGRYRTPAGTVWSSSDTQDMPAPPRIFA